MVPLRRSDIKVLKDLIVTVISNTDFANALADSIDSTEADKLAKSVVNVSLVIGNTLSFIHNLLELEFVRCAFNQGAIMRGNSIASKIMTTYCRKFGVEYLNTVLGELLKSTVENQSLNLEVDPKSLKDGETVERQQQLLTEVVQEYFNKITSDKMVEVMPRNIRAMAGFTANLANKHVPTQTSSLVGGFIMLRFINPSLVTPEFFLQGINLTPSSRRNLTLITKVLQNISNGKPFREDCMLPLNLLIDSNQSAMEAYLMSVATDPNSQDWNDLSSASAIRDVDSIGNEEISFEDYNYFLHLFTNTHQKFVDNLSKIEGDSKNALIQQLTNLKSNKSAGKDLELVVSQVDPYSRTAHLFCAENGIPVKIKIADLFNNKDVTKMCESSQFPVLHDGDKEIKEMDDIINYLNEQYILSPSWLVPPEGKEEEWKELRAWINTDLAIPLCTIVGNFIWKTTRWLDEDVFKEQYATVHAALAKANKTLETNTNFVESSSKGPTILDVFFCCAISLTLSVPGIKLPVLYPHLNRYYVDVNKRYKKWAIVNKEYQQFVKFVEAIVIADENLFVDSHITQNVIFPWHPKATYELLLDPDIPKDKLHEISEAAIKEEEDKASPQSVVSSPSAEQKKKKGWFSKKKDDSKRALSIPLTALPKIADSALSARSPRGEKVLKVSKEVGGTFSMNGRDGRNIYLIPGALVFQDSAFTDWGNDKSMEVFEIYPPINRGRTKVVFRCVDIPTKHLQATEERWEKHWKYLDGLRTVDLHHVVFFSDTRPVELFEMYTTTKKFTKLSKNKGKFEKDGTFELMSKLVVGKTLSSEKPRSLTQEWRVNDWPEGHYSVVVLSIHGWGIGSQMHFKQFNVPVDKARAMMKIHKQKFWNCIGGLWSIDVNQMVVINTPAKDVFETFTDGEKLGAKLGGTCIVGKDKGEPIALLNRLISGVIIQYENSKKLSFTYGRRNWKGYQDKKHKSQANMEFYDLSEKGLTGTLIVLNHSRVPLKYMKQVEEAWPTEIWKKFGGLQVETFTSTVPVKLKKQAMFDALLDSAKMGEMTASSCTINRQIKIFKMYNDTVVGMIADDGDVIRLHWRHKEWPEEYYSEVVFDFDEHKKPALVVVHRYIPCSFFKKTSEVWEEFLKRAAIRQ